MASKAMDLGGLDEDVGRESFLLALACSFTAVSYQHSRLWRGPSSTPRPCEHQDRKGHCLRLTSK